MKLIPIIKDCSIVAFFMAATLLCLQLGYVFQGLQLQASQSLQKFDLASTRASDTFLAGKAVLGVARVVLDTQEGYYRDSASHIKALTKAAAIDTVLLGRLIEHIDSDREVFSNDLNTLLSHTDQAAGEIAEHGHRIGIDLEILTNRLQQNSDSLNDLLIATNATMNGEAIQASLKALNGTMVNVEAGTGHFSEAGKSLEVGLAPLRKTEGKLKAVLKFAVRFFHHNIP